MSVEEQLSALMEKYTKLQAKNKEQVKHIKLLKACDDTSTETISKMDDEIERLKAIIKTQGEECRVKAEMHNNLRRVVDEYFKQALISA